MKRVGYLLLSACLLGSTLMGCDSFDSDETIVSVGKKGTVTTIDVDTFEQTYYTEENFKTFAEEAVHTYNASNGADAVTLSEFSIENNIAKLKMEFQTVEDYSGFNEIPLFQGTIEEALAKGYQFDGTFLSVTNGAASAAAAKADIFAESGLHVVIIQANTDVKVAGKICYVSEQNVTVTAKDTVSIRDEENAALESDVITYIIYK